MTADYTDRTENCNNGILHVAQVSHNRHQDIRKSICTGSGLAQTVVQSVEFLHRFSLVIEHLHNLLSGNKFFHITIHLSNRLLLITECHRGFFSNHSGNHH